MRRAGAILAVVLAVAGASAPAASAHALLEGTSPERGATAAEAPDEVVLRFSEPVEIAFGAVRVFDARSERVDDGTITHPRGAPEAIRVGLRSDLPDGTYTTTYRVVSADGHPVSGGLVFSVGAPGAGPAASVEELLDAGGAGTAARVLHAGSRGLQYGAIALVGGLGLFLLLCWRPALRTVAGAEGRWRTASEALAGRSTRIALTGCAAGLLGAVAGLVAEGAIAGGTGILAAVDPDVLRDVAGTRTGQVVVLQLAAWVVLVLAVLGPAPRRATALRPAALGADGQASAPGRLGLLALALPAALLVASPALEGHQVTQEPIWANVSLGLLHVAAVTAWLGGIAALLLVLPAATGRLEPGERTRLLAGVLERFSPVALACVAVILLTGTVTAILQLTALDDLLSTGYGRAILVKASLLLVLVGLGAVNRRRVVPRLRALAAGAGEAPGAAGRLLRRTLRTELAVLVVVLGTTGALVGTSPPGAGAAGPFSERVGFGPLDLEVTVDPARTGPNELHVYLFDGATGAPFGGVREMALTARQLEAGIGPLPVTLRPSGPGHFTADVLPLQPGGTWELRATARVSEFDRYETDLEVPIR